MIFIIVFIIIETDIVDINVDSSTAPYPQTLPFLKQNGTKYGTMMLQEVIKKQ